MNEAEEYGGDPPAGLNHATTISSKRAGGMVRGTPVASVSITWRCSVEIRRSSLPATRSWEAVWHTTEAIDSGHAP